MKVLMVFGTRPEAIKMAPVACALRDASGINFRLCLTGQHREMLAGVMDLFDLRADYDLAIMRAKQDLTYITASVLTEFDLVLASEQPDWVLVHGDTTTALAAAMGAFYRGNRIGHIEAGLRTGDMQQPWPEEMNRSVIDRLATLRFSRTESARDNLLRENIPVESIIVTGNTVVDALNSVKIRLDDDLALRRGLEKQFSFLDPGKRLVLVTGHRRENFGQGFERICRGLWRIATETDVEIVYPIHLNPRVQEPVRRILGSLPNVHLLEPLDYVPFVYLMMRCNLILTDSGGIQEEAPSLGKRVLVMRDVTERPEAMAAGLVTLVGTDEHRIHSSVVAALDIPLSTVGPVSHNPYGDGQASIRIRDALLDGSY